MGVLEKGTSSVLLLLAFNICCIFCQNAGQECSFTIPHQGKVYNDYSTGIDNAQPPKNNIRFYPANRPPIEPNGVIAECQKSPTQENVYPTLNQQTVSSLEPGPNFGQTNKHSRSELLCSNESCNGQGAPPPYSEQSLNPKPCPEPPITPCAPQNPAQFEAFPQGPFQRQPFSHGTARGVFSPLSFTNPDRSVQTPVNDVECPQQNPPLSSNSAFTSLSVPMLRKFFTPLVPYPNARLPLPCADTQPSLFTQGLSVPVEPLNNQGCLINQADVLPLQQSQETSPREQNNPINYPPLSLEPKQILPNPPVVCLPQTSTIEPYDTLPESQPCSSIPPGPSSIDPFHDPSSLSTCDQCKVTRSLCSCPGSSCPSCQPACHFSVCDDEPSLFQIQTSLQLPHNIPSCVCSEIGSSQLYSDFNPSISLNSGCCSCTNNDFCIPQTCCAPQSCCVTQSCGTPNNCFGPSRPQLSCDYSPPCSACAMPTSMPVCRPSCENPCHSPETMFCMPQPCCAPQPCCVTQTCGTPNNCYCPSNPQMSCDCSSPCSSCAIPSSTPICLPSCESPCPLEPINVQINVPPPIIPAPSITIINTPPETAPTSIDSGYFDTSPIIIDSRRRRSKSWLPLLLVWLFSCDGF